MGSAERTYCKKKEELGAALETVRREKQSDHALIVDVWRSQRINGLLGFGFLAPWEVRHLDEEWLMVLDGLADMREEKVLEEKQKRAGEDAFAKVRARHPSYRKY